MSGHAVTREHGGRKSMARRHWEGGATVEEWPGGNACWEGSMAHLTPACPLLKLGRSVRTIQTPPRLAMWWSSCFRWVCTVGRVYLGWSVDVCQAGVVVAKRKSAHFLLFQRKSQQSGSFKLRFTLKSPLFLSICCCCVYHIWLWASI